MQVYNKLIIFTCLLSFQALADGHKTTIKKFDINNDGKDDRFEYYENDKYIKLEEDLNSDGKIDYITSYDNDLFLKIELQDTNYDGKFNRKRFFRVLDEKKYEVITEVDNNHDGQYEIKYKKIIDRDQKDEACLSQGIALAAKSLAEEAILATADLNKGFVPTDFGYQIEKACISRWGAGFIQVVEDTIEKGLACLDELQKKSSKIIGAGRNLSALKQLLKEPNKVTLICDEKHGYDWSDTAAHASASIKDNINSNKKIKHPFISLNPNHPSSKGEATEYEIREIQRTIFHEQLHNLGFLHEEDIEYSYTCEICCLGEGDDDILKQDACKVCSGDYQNDVSYTYVEDFVKFSNSRKDYERGFNAVMKYLKENPQDVKGIALLVKASSADIFNPVGVELAKLILEKGKEKPDLLSKSIKVELTDALYYEGSTLYNGLENSSKLLAESLYESSFNQSEAKALKLIDKGKIDIKKEISSMKRKAKKDPELYSKYPVQEIEKKLKNTLRKMWLDNYEMKDNTELLQISKKAYELLLYFDMI